MTQREYKSKALDIADRLGFEILIENDRVYLQSEEIKNELLRIKQPQQTWSSIFQELKRWGDGCNLMMPFSR